MFYITLLTNGKLNSHLADIDERAQEMMLCLTEQIEVQERVAERLKAESPVLRVDRMNEIQARVREIVYADIIYN